MNENLVKKVVQEFARDNRAEYKNIFKISGIDNDFFVVTIERQRRSFISESLALEARNNTISALPSGTPCSCCGGSGKS